MAPTASPRFHSTGVLPTSARPSTQDLVAAAQAAMDEAVDRFASYANSGVPSSGGECAVWRVRSIRSSASAAATAAPIIDPVGGPTECGSNSAAFGLIRGSGRDESGRCCFSTGLTRTRPISPVATAHVIGDVLEFCIDLPPPLPVPRPCTFVSTLLMLVVVRGEYSRNPRCCPRNYGWARM